MSWLIDFWVDWCLANGTDPDQMPQNSSAASDQGLHCFTGFSRYTYKFLKLLCLQFTFCSNIKVVDTR